jgi:glycosyltransferase involved in cell wall biosynthesis
MLEPQEGVLIAAHLSRAIGTFRPTDVVLHCHPLMSTLVSHPHVTPVSARLAGGLADQRKLAGYFTGLAFAGTGWSAGVAAALTTVQPVIQNRIVAALPADKLRSFPATELAARLAARAAVALRLPLGSYDALFVGHDRAVAASRWPRDITAVYAYEDGAWHTFERAARRGITRVWDLPTPEHRTVGEIFGEEQRRWPDAALGPPHVELAWKLRRKEAELALADKISVASTFTRKSLERIDVRAPIVVAPYGFPIDDFSPRDRTRNDRFLVISVGSHDLRKGTPYLLEAWKRAALPDAELRLIGPLRLAKPFLDRYAGLFTHLPPIPRAALGRHYAEADLLVFPTLGDGFGLVIQEAMCTATPVLTTTSSGGPECITDGADGWIVPPRDIDALVERLRACAADRDATRAVGLRARARAERWTWHDATAAAITALEL